MSSRTTLKSFLDERRMGSGDRRVAAVTGMGEVAGKYFISDEDYPQFLTQVNKHLFTDKGRQMNLV